MKYCFAAFAALIAIARISCWHFFEVKHLDRSADRDVGKIKINYMALLIVTLAKLLTIENLNKLNTK